MRHKYCSAYGILLHVFFVEDPIIRIGKDFLFNVKGYFYWFTQMDVNTGISRNVNGVFRRCTHIAGIIIGRS